MAQEIQKWPIEIKDLYKTLIDTRNFEIAMFWQRSNYFLGLNAGVALGFFNLKDPKYAFSLAVIGLVASFLWFCSCLGSKFWQTRWEQRLQDFEKEYLTGLDFFSATSERVRNDVARGFDFSKRGVPRSIYRTLVMLKPSVSISMIGLSLIFVSGWLIFIIAFLRSTKL